MAKNHLKNNSFVPGLDSKYNGAAYKKPRRMKPRNMTEEAIDSFLAGHVDKHTKATKANKRK